MVDSRKFLFHVEKCEGRVLSATGCPKAECLQRVEFLQEDNICPVVLLTAVYC